MYVCVVNTSFRAITFIEKLYDVFADSGQVIYDNFGWDLKKYLLISAMYQKRSGSFALSLFFSSEYDFPGQVF